MLTSVSKGKEQRKQWKTSNTAFKETFLELEDVSFQLERTHRG